VSESLCEAINLARVSDQPIVHVGDPICSSSCRAALVFAQDEGRDQTDSSSHHNHHDHVCDLRNDDDQRTNSNDQQLQETERRTFVTLPMETSSIKGHSYCSLCHKRLLAGEPSELATVELRAQCYLQGHYIFAGTRCHSSHLNGQGLLKCSEEIHGKMLKDETMEIEKGEYILLKNTAADLLQSTIAKKKKNYGILII
jgi:hypothetical protein